MNGLQHAQTHIRTKRYLVLSGGGIHGLSHIGFVSYIKFLLGGDDHFRSQFRGFAGTSIGAFMSLLLCCGETSMSRLFCWMTNPRFFLRILQSINLKRTWETYGAVPTWVGLSYVQEILDAYHHCRTITFHDLYVKTGKELCVVVVNASTGQAECHSHKTTPHLAVAPSVYASMCVPFLCEPMKLNGMYYFDGGILNNFPLLHCGFPSNEILGCYLQTEVAIHTHLQQPPSVKSWFNFIIEMIYIMCRPSSNVYFSKTNEMFEQVVVIPQSRDIHFLKIWANSSELYKIYVRGIYYTKLHFQLHFVKSILKTFHSSSPSAKTSSSEQEIVFNP